MALVYSALQTHGYKRNGTKGSALDLTTVIDKNNLAFKSVERRYGNQVLPDIMNLEVQRSK